MKLPTLAGRLERHLAGWLGAWPPTGELTIVGSPHRVRPSWDGKVYPVAGVETPEGTVLSVPPDAVEAVRAAGDDVATIGPALPAIVGRPDARFGRGVFRWCQQLLDDCDPEAVWLPPDDERHHAVLAGGRGPHHALEAVDGQHAPTLAQGCDS